MIKDNNPIARHLERRRSELPTDPSKLRKYITSVARRRRVRLTDAEIDGLVQAYEITAPKKAKKSPIKSPGKKTGNTTI